MSKPSQNKDLKPTDDVKIGQTPTKPALDTNLLVIISTIVMVVVIVIFNARSKRKFANIK